MIAHNTPATPVDVTRRPPIRAAKICQARPGHLTAQAT
jgi:hypothetical protein